MSQFRDKKIDTGVPDDWNFRTNDDGATLGDDIVAEDPNDLARAMIDTQTELLKASVYAPGDLIDANSGALERIKLLEDNVGSISLQDAYENGNFINPNPGSNIILGAGGVIEIDSGQNLLINPNTMRVYQGAEQLDFTHNSITSSTTNVTMGTVSPSQDFSLLGGNDLFLKDGNLISTVTLSESGVTALTTTSQSIIGAINEVSGGFTSANLQQIYDQSSPPRIDTTLAGGKFIVANGTGNPFIPALEVQGELDVIGELKVDLISVGPFLSPNATLASDGTITSNNTIASTSLVEAPEITAPIGSLTLSDSLGSADLTNALDPSLNTTKTTIFGAINEVNTLATNNALGLAAFGIQHDSGTGLHGIITTQADPGQNSINRIAVKDDGGTDQFTVKGTGVVNAANVLLPSYDLANELSLNETHRADDGTSHSAVATHLAAANPHNTVKFLNVDGSPNLSGNVILQEGAGITLTQVGQNIEISAAAGSTLQGVYDTQANGNLDLAVGKNLFLRDASSQNIASFEQNDIQLYKDITIRNGSDLDADSSLAITANGVLDLQSSVANVNITSTGGQVVIESVPFAPTAGGSLPSYTQSNLIDSHNEILDQRFWDGDTLNPFTNETNFTIPKGSPVLMEPATQNLWTVIPNANTTGSNEAYKSVWGLVDEDVLPGATARVRHYGIMEIALGQMDVSPDGQFQTGDILYASAPAEATVEFTDITLVANNDTITLDVGGADAVYTAKSFGADNDLGEFDIAANADLNIRNQFTIENLVAALNNDVFQTSNGSINIRAFPDGTHARAHVTLTGTTTVGDTFTIGAGALLAVGSNDVTFTAVAAGAKTQEDEFEVGNSPSHTARNLAEAIVDERVKKVGGLNGHQCRAEVNGDTITITYQNRGIHGNSITLSTTSADITTPANLTGGISVAKIYRLFRDATGKTLSTSNGAAISVGNHLNDESESLFVAQRRILATSRVRNPIEKFIKVGKIVGSNLPNYFVKLDLEEPDVIEA